MEMPQEDVVSATYNGKEKGGKIEMNNKIDKNGKIRISVRPIQSKKLHGGFTCDACGHTVRKHELACPCRGAY